MRITVLCLSALVAVVSLARAQEESPSPAPNDPTVSVTTEKTLSPTPKPASPTPKPKASPSASPSKSSSPAAPKSSPSASPKSSASPASSASPSATASGKKSTPEATIREIEDKWEAGVKNHDTTIPQTYLAEDFRGISSKGKVMTKANLLAEVKKDTDVYDSTKNGKIDVRVFDGQFAVATGVATEVGKDKAGQAFKRSFRWTDVWVLRKEKWECVASQAMLVQ